MSYLSFYDMSYIDTLVTQASNLIMELNKIEKTETPNTLTESSNHSPKDHVASKVTESITRTPASSTDAATSQSQSEHAQEADKAASEGSFWGWATVVSG